jgi:hypothetical protein
MNQIDLGKMSGEERAKWDKGNERIPLHCRCGNQSWTTRQHAEEMEMKITSTGAAFKCGRCLVRWGKQLEKAERLRAEREAREAALAAGEVLEEVEEVEEVDDDLEEVNEYTPEPGDEEK